MKNREKTIEMTTTALLATVLAVLGTFKLPSIVPGCEFQLSAPFAVCIAACFGFRRYIRIGILASAINLILGTHTIVNVTIAMIFRLVAGGILALFGINPITLALSGPLGTVAGRLVLGGISGTDSLALIAAAVPGMVFTAVAATVMYPVMKRLARREAGALTQG
ncbi:MAG: hypothetical protein HFH97_13515 [Lachnospiraceae bacterium]|nr:hypothetical protein [uncultured Acetatifactor sp.]MCI9231939.1 hypothetical protein [Lachnospiraceae bacterium]MCI9573597.1 hypothetical protein [Lachnospiraceae bacterium]